MTTVRSFRDLIVWQRAMALAERGYRLTARFPRHELYGLTSQLRRALVSVPSNIAEGHNSLSTAIYLSHLSTALGSQAEVETQLVLSARLGFVSDEEIRPVLDAAAEVGRMLHGLVRALHDSSP